MSVLCHMTSFCPALLMLVTLKLVSVGGVKVLAAGGSFSLPCASQVLLVEHDINTSPFTPAVHACVPPLPWSVTQADIDDPNR